MPQKNPKHPGKNSLTPVERRRRRLQIRREAERRLAQMESTPTLRSIYAPRILFAAIFVLAILGSVLIGRVSRSVQDSPNRPIPHRVAIHSLDVLATALGRYRMHVGDFPSTTHGLRALNADPGLSNWNGPYLIALRNDPWNRPYHYERGTNALPILFSLGPDGLPFTNDDLRPGTEFFTPGTEWTNQWLHRQDRLPTIPLPLDE